VSIAGQTWGIKHILVWISRCAWLVIEALVSKSDEMIAVNRLDVCGDGSSPVGDRGRGARARGRSGEEQCKSREHFPR
jgi:hypothetical protein